MTDLKPLNKNNKADAYLEHVFNEWAETNKPALISEQKLKVLESFSEGLSSLLAEHDISIPDSDYDIVEASRLELAEAQEENEVLFDGLLNTCSKLVYEGVYSEGEHEYTELLKKGLTNDNNRTTAPTSPKENNK